METENREIFNGIAGKYINPWCIPGRKRKKIEKIADSLGLKKGMKVLEPGCGRGDFSSFILERITGSGFLYLADVSEKMLDYAGKNTGGFENVKLIRKCACSTGIKENSLDAVAAFNSFPHFYPKQKFVDHFSKILKKNK